MTLELMTAFLNKLGYSIKEDTEVRSVNYNGHAQSVEVKVFNVYYRNQVMTNFLLYLKGSDRIKWVYDHEREKLSESVALTIIK
jgi:hypothetical protein